MSINKTKKSMCSFLITNLTIAALEYVNFFLKCRGPDYTNTVEKNGVTFVHNLLHMTGTFTPQPFVDEEHDIVCLFNGEIYNYKELGDYDTDGKCIIPMYQKHGNGFLKKLDGEFAIVVFDFSKGHAILSTDTFETKPFWYCVRENGEFGMSSYESPLSRLGFTNLKRLTPNTTLVLDIANNYVELSKDCLYEWDLTQYKTDTKDWQKAFENAIIKRAKNTIHPVFICLSSGYDSGLIACALNNLGIPYASYTIYATETKNVIDERLHINKEKTCIEQNIFNLKRSEHSEAKERIINRVEPYIFYFPVTDKYQKIEDDGGACGMSHICNIASGKRQLIFLSGQGADEIISDYGFNGVKWFDHSEFGGLFPNDLSEVFPWKSFYGGSQRNYLTKEEYISGGYGIEGRYPFLDRNVVQEYLWLDNAVKNSVYKKPIDDYLDTFKYPIDRMKKIGFSAGDNLEEDE